MAEPLIELKAVRFAYGSKKLVLDGVDFELYPGERVGLIGSNGCGKTTFLHLLVGLLFPQAGSIHAFGKVRADEASFREVRRRAGLVFQDADDQLFCPTVIEDVAFGPLNLGKTAEEARRDATETLELLGLTGLEERITYTLSGGEKQRVALATVLAMKPEVLLLDEPTEGLDEEARARTLAILSKLPQAMILVSHEREFVRNLATRMVHMNGGGLVELPS